MGGYCTLDCETSIQYKIVEVKKPKNKHATTKRVQTVHGPTFRDPKNDIYTFIYGDHPNRIKLLHNEEGFKRKLPDEFVGCLNKSHTLIMMNGKFDLCYLWHNPELQEWILNGGKLWDIQLARYLLSGQRHQFPSLAELEKIFLGIKTKVGAISRLFEKCIGADEILKTRHVKRNRFNCYEYYCYNDGRSPMLIFQKQYSQARRLGMLSIIEMYNVYLLALCMIETNGIPIDLRNTEIKYNEFNLVILEYLKKAQTLVQHLWTDKRLPELNVNSGDHKSVLLFGGPIKGEDIYWDGESYYGPKAKKAGQKKTKKIDVSIIVPGLGTEQKFKVKTKKDDIYSVDKNVIAKIRSKSQCEKAKQFCEYIEEASKYEKISNTYLKAFLERSVEGIIYPNYNNTATITSRLSSSKPNMQNIPTNGQFKKDVQGLLKAGPDETCCQVDFSQLEVFGQALLTGDKNLINDLLNGADFHIKWMCRVYPEVTYEQGYKLCKIDEDPKWTARRKSVKPITFGEQYGQMYTTLAADTGLDVEMLKEAFERKAKEYPQITEFEQAVVEEVQTSAIVSRKTDISSKYTKGNKDAKGLSRKYKGNVELLPIRKRDKVTYYFDSNEIRHVGFYRSPTCKIYAFEEFGSLTKNDDIFRYYKPTQMKNYMIQGTAGDIQAATTAELLPYLLKNKDKVRMVNEIHDSKWFIIKTKYLDEVIPIIIDTMQSVKDIFKRRFGITTDLPFPVEAEIGPNFAELEAYKPKQTEK